MPVLKTRHAMLVADVFVTLGGVASAIAAIGALIALVYAKRTVYEARAARNEARTNYLDAVQKQQAEFEVEAAAHRQALSAQIVLEQLIHLAGVSTSLTAIIRAAYDELISPPPQLPEGEGQPTLLPTLFQQLHVSTSLLRSLGGPDLPNTTKFALEPFQVADAGNRIKLWGVIAKATLLFPELTLDLAFNNPILAVLRQQGVLGTANRSQT